MRVVVAGGTGFLGRALTAALAAREQDVVVLTRGLPAGAREPAGGSRRVSRVGWTPDGRASAWASTIDGAGALVNLAGESIADRRWSEAQKQRIRDSRVLATRSLVTAIGAAAHPPATFVSGSAVGYYGSRGADRLTEPSAAGSDFLARVCVDWEEAATSAASARTRVALVRTGLVLARDGGALPRMLLPFRLMAGGPLGSGDQYMAWIHRDDWVALVSWVLQKGSDPEFFRSRGADGKIQDATPLVFNATAPTPVTNRDFMKTVGRVMYRPSWLPAPAFALRLALGEMADALLLSSQRAFPERAQAMGFEFRYPDLEGALNAILH